MTHNEAFALMKYASKDGRIIEYIWNSRDGVTPFGVLSRDGKTELFHADWHLDQKRRTHLPQPGDRVFIDLTPEAHREFIVSRVESWWEHPEYPMRDVFESKEDAVKKLFRAEWREGEPHLFVATEEWIAANCTWVSGGRFASPATIR